MPTIFRFLVHKNSSVYFTKNVQFMSQRNAFYLDVTLTICREGDVFLGNAQIEKNPQMPEGMSIPMTMHNIMTVTEK